MRPVLALLPVLCACGGSDLSFRDLLVSAEALEAWNGRLVEVLVVDDEGEVVLSDGGSVVDGGFSFLFPGGLDEGRTYEVLAYVDVSDDLSCQSPPADAGFRRSTGQVEGSIALQFDADGGDEVCVRFAP